MQSLTDAYIQTLLWAETGDDMEPVDKEWNPSNIDPASLKSIERDCASFQEKAKDILAGLNIPDSQVGHDFLLTRNRHGAGFWDSPEKYGIDGADKLTVIAHSFGETEIYVGDDGVLYIMGEGPK
jgi:hypothetical protein